MSNIVSIHDHQERVWQEYIDAKSRMDLSGAIDDGRACAKAYSRWLSLFMTEDQREFIGGDRRHSA